MRLSNSSGRMDRSNVPSAVLQNRIWPSLPGVIKPAAIEREQQFVAEASRMGKHKAVGVCLSSVQISTRFVPAPEY